MLRPATVRLVQRQGLCKIQRRQVGLAHLWRGGGGGASRWIRGARLGWDNKGRLTRQGSPLSLETNLEVDAAQVVEEQNALVLAHNDVLEGRGRKDCGE